MGPPRPEVNVQDFQEFDPNGYINSPRSLRACSEEGISNLDLVYKTLDTFAEKGLSPRLVKLRYDFHEAKRKDLLFSTRRTRDRIIEDEARKSMSRHNVDQFVADTGLDKGTLLALQSDSLKRERIKFLRAQQLQKEWLKSTLQTELVKLEELEQADTALREEGNRNEEALRQQGLRAKEINDKRRELEEQKRLQQLAEEKYEKQMAKEEFIRQQHEQEKIMEKQREEDRIRHERNMIEAEKQRKKEEEAEEKKRREFELHAQQLEALRLNDIKRKQILDEKQEIFKEELQTKQANRENRINVSMRNLALVEAKKRDDLDEKMMRDEEREMKLAQEKALIQEEGAKKSFQLMMKRKQIAEDALRIQEIKRKALTDARMQTEKRLMLHEHKKQRYLEFKRELDSLKERNKDINVTRQRRKEEHHRSEVEEEANLKSAKSSALLAQKEALWKLRRNVAIASQSAREQAKETVIHMKIKSKPRPKVLKKRMDEVLGQDIFSPKVIRMSHSMPGLGSLPA